MNFLATLRPQIAREIPLVTSGEELEIAKGYLKLTKPAADEVKSKLIDMALLTK